MVKRWQKLCLWIVFSVSHVNNFPNSKSKTEMLLTFVLYKSICAVLLLTSSPFSPLVPRSPLCPQGPWWQSQTRWKHVRTDTDVLPAVNHTRVHVHVPGQNVHTDDPGSPWDPGWPSSPFVPSLPGAPTRPGGPLAPCSPCQATGSIRVKQTFNTSASL